MQSQLCLWKVHEQYMQYSVAHSTHLNISSSAAGATTQIAAPSIAVAAGSPPSISDKAASVEGASTAVPASVRTSCSPAAVRKLRSPPVTLQNNS
jgi:hypothetical protein